MDYFDLLHQAQMNSKNVTVQETRCYKTSFAVPKKVERSRVSSDNIKKFLARKEEEEKKKTLDAQKKKEELLALRAMDKKSYKRVQTMLKRTKSANKSVMEDAIDNYNTKDTLEGPQQCDEDDYGYVSQEASALYEKLMAKYEKAPVENLKQMSREVKDLKAAKDRVKAALDREAEEQLHPTRKRKRKHEDGDVEADKRESVGEAQEKFEKNNEKFEKNIEKEQEKERPKKIPKKMPPPVDFFELMKIAAKKQHEPIVIEKKVQEPERPMTMKEKMERQKELDRINRKSDPKNHNVSKPSHEKSSSSSSSSSSKEESSNKVPSKSKTSSDSSDPSKLRAILKGKTDVDSKNSVLQSGKKEVKFSSKKEEGSSAPRQPLNKNLPIYGDNDKINKSQLKLKPQAGGPSKSSVPSTKNLKDQVQPDVESPAEVDLSDIDKEIALLMKKRQQVMEAGKAQKNKIPSHTSKDPQEKPPIQSKPSSIKSVGFSPKKQNTGDRSESLSKIRDKDETMVKRVTDRDKERMKSSIDRDKIVSKVSSEREKLQPKGGKVSESKPPPQRRFSPPRYGPPTRPPQSQMKKKPPNKRVIDSESEYDSEMDDFIDDGPEDCMDYSRHIKEIFGYDKSRYAHVDEDECEEASYRTQMIEERRSAKIGLMEDLEDIQREKEEKARAKARLMKKKAAMRS